MHAPAVTGVQKNDRESAAQQSRTAPASGNPASMSAPSNTPRNDCSSHGSSAPDES